MTRIYLSKHKGRPLHDMDPQAAKSIIELIMKKPLKFCDIRERDCGYAQHEVCQYSFIFGTGDCKYPKKEKVEKDPKQLTLF